MTWLHRFALDAPQPVAKHSGLEPVDLVKGQPRDQMGRWASGSGGGGGNPEVARMKEGKKIGNSISVQAFKHESAMNREAGKSLEREVNMRNLNYNMRGAARAATEGDFKGATAKLDRAIKLSSSVASLDNLTSHLRTSQAGLNQLAGS